MNPDMEHIALEVFHRMTQSNNSEWEENATHRRASFTEVPSSTSGPFGSILRRIRKSSFINSHTSSQSQTPISSAVASPRNSRPASPMRTMPIASAIPVLSMNPPCLEDIASPIHPELQPLFGPMTSLDGNNEQINITTNHNHTR